MSHGSCQIDVSQTLPANLGLNYFNPALLTNDAAVLHSFVFTAVALVVLYGTKDLSAEETVTLRLKRPVIDGLRFLHFPVRPLPNLFRTGNRNTERAEVNWVLRLLEK